MDSYLTIRDEAIGFYKEKGSKFHAHAFPVQNEEAVKLALEKLRKQYHDARHHCYGYSLGYDQPYQRANDDGEPNHSAGDPILGQIKSAGLTNVLVVVVRYFGGTKLGVSGLINAYKTAAADAINNADIITQWITQTVSIHFPYENTNEVMRAIDELGITITHQEFLETCFLEGQIITSKKDKIADYFKLIPAIEWTVK